MLDDIQQKKNLTLVEVIQKIDEALHVLNKLKFKAAREEFYSETYEIGDIQSELITFRDNLNENYVQPFHIEHENEQMNYQQLGDKIFAKGSLWKHRTLRTLFDPFASEYDRTSMKEKIMILYKILSSEFCFEQIIAEYKAYYRSLYKPHVSNAFEKGLLALIMYQQRDGNCDK